MQNILGVIDIHSHGVSGALLTATDKLGHQGGICRESILVHHEDISFNASHHLEGMLGQLVEGLRKTAEIIREKSGQRKIVGHCFLSSPFYVDRTKIIRLGQKEPRLFQQKFFDQVLEREARKFMETQPRLYTEVIDDEHRLLESKILQVKLNRYRVSLPIAQKTLAKEAEVALYLCLTSTAILSRLESILCGAHWKNLTFHPFSYALYRVNQLLPTSREHAVIANVEEEITEVVVVSQGILLDTFSFPVGTNHLVREYVKIFGTVPAEAVSALNLYFAGQQTSATAAKIKKFLVDQGGHWLGPLQRSLDQTLDQFLLSPEFLVVTASSFAPIFVDWLRQAPASDLVISNLPLAPRLLADPLLKDYCGGSADSPHDLRLMLEGIFCDRIIA